jgi:hypothetical protein
MTRHLPALLLSIAAVCGAAYRDAAVSACLESGVRFSSELTVCDEAPRGGHWVNRYWLSTGMVKPEFHLEGEKNSFEGAPSRVYHHTPVLPITEPSAWLVIEYATKDSTRAVTGLFRTAQSGDDTFVFKPRGLDLGRTYLVTFSNTGHKVPLTRARLMDGIPVRLDAAMTSELLLFEAR